MLLHTTDFNWYGKKYILPPKLSKQNKNGSQKKMALNSSSLISNLVKPFYFILAPMAKACNLGVSKHLEVVS